MMTYSQSFPSQPGGSGEGEVHGVTGGSLVQLLAEGGRHAARQVGLPYPEDGLPRHRQRPSGDVVVSPAYQCVTIQEHLSFHHQVISQG